MTVKAKLQGLLLGFAVLLLCAAVLARLIVLNKQQDEHAAQVLATTLSELKIVTDSREAFSQLRLNLARRLFADTDTPARWASKQALFAEDFTKFGLAIAPLRTIDPVAHGQLTRTGAELADIARRLALRAEHGEASAPLQVPIRFPDIAKKVEPLINSLATARQGELGRIFKANSQRGRDFLLPVGLLCLALLAVLCLLAVLVHRAVMVPVSTLETALNRITQGERLLKSPITGHNEFARMGDALVSLSQSSADLTDLAYNDTLTGLPNLARFEQRLQHHLLRQQPFCVMFCNLDNFRTLNDGYGHVFGNCFLNLAATRLQTLATGAEVFRHGADAFVLLAPHNGAEALADGVRRAMAEPTDVAGRSLPMSISMGLALYPDHGIDADVLVSAADAAMYQAKRLGRNCVQMAHGEHLSWARSRLQLAEDLRAAIGTGQIQPYFQPILDIASGQVASVESLARWKHPVRGFVPPDEFIGIAEAAGLIDALTQQLLRSSCQAIMAWQGPGQPKLLAFNLSARQVRPGVVEVIQAILTETGMPAQQLEIEITEGAIIERPEIAEKLLGDLRAIGVSVALDDFGTGYSSLSYLLRFQIDKIKVDKSFVSRLEDQRQASKIVAATIALATSLNMKLVAEGVERVPQMLALYELGCTLQQGWLYAKAMPAEEFVQWQHSAPLKLGDILRSQPGYQG